MNRRGAETQRRAYLGLGSNVGDREGNLREAIARLKRAPGVNFLRQSRVYQTEPIGVTDQPEFLNMVVEVQVGEGVSGRELLALVKRIETEVGRKQRERWGPREIDVDVLLFGDERIVEDGFEVPHPRMWERAFVMAPLAELEPDMKTPSGETVANVAERLGREQEVRHLGRDGGGTRKRWWQRLWDWLPVAVAAIVVSWHVFEACLRAAIGPFVHDWGWTVAYVYAVGTIVTVWLGCALLLAIVLIVKMVTGRPGAWQAAKGLLVLLTILFVGWAYHRSGLPQAALRLEPGGLKRAITARTSIPDLQAAAAAMLQRSRPDGRWVVLEGSQVSTKSDVPLSIVRLKPDFLVVSPNASDRQGYVKVVWAGGFTVWGVLVGQPDFTPGDSNYYRWADGVYGFIVGADSGHRRDLTVR